MRVLLTEGSGLTSRQVAGRLWALGHDVGILSSDPLCLTRFTRGVRRWHRTPRYGTDPLAWLDVALATHLAHDYDVLFPTQEQVAVLAAARARLERASVATAVPSFDALAAVQDKVAAAATLERVGVPQPRSDVLRSRDDALRWEELPVYCKAPIGTASAAVRLVERRADLVEVFDHWERSGVLVGGGMLVQRPVPGPLAMVQSVFARGELVAFHANLRVRQGAGGGASHKRGVDLPDVRTSIAALGRALRWHGALSADVILSADGPRAIDVNPRLVEPGNAWRSGVDLVSAVLEVARDGTAPVRPPARPGVRTHQLLLAVLGAAEQGRGRRGVAAELIDAAARRGDYRDSSEELIPLRRDWRAAVPLVAAAAAVLAAPGAGAWFAGGSVGAYALTPRGWQAVAGAAERGAG